MDELDKIEILDGNAIKVLPRVVVESGEKGMEKNMAILIEVITAKNREVNSIGHVLNNVSIKVVDAKVNKIIVEVDD